MPTKAATKLGAVLALICTFGHSTLASAGQNCGVSTPCPDSTPHCVTPGLLNAGQVCSICRTDSDCQADGITGSNTVGGGICQADGRCYSCTADFHAADAGTACPSNDRPACDMDNTQLTGHCTQCSSSLGRLCAGQTPECVLAKGVCGCNGASSSCPTGFSCDLDGGASGECFSTSGCDASTCTSSTAPICDPAVNSCVQCETPGDCGGVDETCDPTTHTCALVGTLSDGGSLPDGGVRDDAGTGDGGATSGGDGGTTTGSTDGGPGLVNDGGAIGPEQGDATLNGGNGGNVTYPYGHVEGGGCSVIPSSDSTGAAGAASALLTGLAAIAGIMSIRTRRRRSGEDRSR